MSKFTVPEFKVILMTNFKLNDVVIVTKNPPNQIVKIKGDIGYIDEFQELTNEKGEVTKFIYFKTIELNSFCGGMGSVPIDCIEICNNPVYLKRFQEILEHQKKENEKYNLIQTYSDLERSLKNKEEEIIKLKEKSQILGNAFNMLKVHLTDRGQLLMMMEADKINTRLFELDNEIVKVKEEMNTPVNKNIARYLDYCRNG